MSAQRSGKQAECRVLIAGVGNGGCCAVAEMARQWNNGPAMVGINTDARALSEATGLRCIQIGAQVMKDMGTGGDPHVGRRAAEADLERVRELFHDVTLVVFVVGLGGGTGTGAAPILVAEAKKAGALTLCFAMMPFEFEGQRRMEHARHGLLALNDAADGVISLPNQRLVEMVEDRANIAEAFRKADAMLCRGVQAVWRVICRQGIINLDFSDLKNLLQDSSGHCVFGCAEGAGTDKIEIALSAIREDPLLKHGQVMSRAHSYIVSIIGGTDLTLKDVDRLMQGIAAISRSEALAMAGVSCDPAFQDKVFVTILASEKAAKSEPQKRSPPPPVEAAAAPPPAEADDFKSPRKRKLTQPLLFDTVEQGRFTGIDPTIIEGSNLDIPTFIRRGLMIQKVRNGGF